MCFDASECWHQEKKCHACHGDDDSVEQPIWSAWKSERKISFISKDNSVLPLFNSYFQKAIFFQTRHMSKWFNSRSHTGFLKMNHVIHGFCFNHQSGTDPLPPLQFSLLHKLPSNLGRWLRLLSINVSKDLWWLVQKAIFSLFGKNLHQLEKKGNKNFKQAGSRVLMLTHTLPLLGHEGHLSSAGGEVFSPTPPCDSLHGGSALPFVTAVVYNWLPAGASPSAELTSSTRLKMIQLYHHTYLLLRLHAVALCWDLPFTLSNFIQPQRLGVYVCV